MITIATNNSNDIYLGQDGNLAMARDMGAVSQGCTHISQVLLGELPYAQTRGIPFFDIGFKSSPDLSLYQVYLTKLLLTVPHVNRVDSLTFKSEGENLSYEAYISTDYGEGVISVNL